MVDERDIFGLVGANIDRRFTVGGVVGEGGFAVVYEGKHLGLDAKVAIKCLKIPAKLGEDERKQFLESFLAEGRLLHKLARSDRGIVDAIDVGATTSPNGKWVPYIVLEWLDGCSLEEDFTERRRNKTKGRSLGESIRLLDSAARGLATAHRAGIAHRDVKPANVFLLRGGGDIRTKVLDFGIAKVKADSPDLMRAFEVTGSSLQAFTPRYGAPEQFDRSYGATGPWTDVFALALILVECVAGKSAMDGDPAQLYVTASNREKRPTLRAMGHEEGDAIEAILLRALEVDSAKRTSDVGTFWSALTEAVTTGDTQLSRAFGPKKPQEASTKRDGRPSHPADIPALPVPPTRRADPTPSLLAANSDASDALPRAKPAVPSEGALAAAARSRNEAPAENMPILRGATTQRSEGTPAPLVEPPSAAYPQKPSGQVNVGLALLGAALLGGAALWGLRSAPAGTLTLASGAASSSNKPPPIPSSLPSTVVSASSPDALSVAAPPGFTAHRTPIFDIDLPEGFAPRGNGFALGEDATIHLETGVASASTLEELFRSAHLMVDGGSRYVTHEESRANSFLVAGLDGDRAFADRLIIGEGRYARLRVDYGPLAKDRVEPKLEHMLASFTLVARSAESPKP